MSAGDVVLLAVGGAFAIGGIAWLVRMARPDIGIVLKPMSTADVPNPQSVPAITFSLPTIRANCTMR